MANTIGYGQGAVNNTNGFGKSATNNTIDFGEVCADSWSPETNLVGGSFFTNEYSVLLDGVDDYINCGNVDMTSATEQSFSLWFNTSVGTGYLFSQYTSEDNRQIFVYFTSTRLDIYANGSIRYRVTLPSAIPLNVWNHIVITFNGANAFTDRWNVYLNNGSAYTGNAFNGNASFNANTNEDFLIGKYNNSTFFEWEGYIDEFSIWTKELTAQERSDIYNSGVPNDVSSLGISGLANYWRMGDNDSGTGTTVTDQGSRANNGTLVNAPTFETNVPT